VRSQTRACRRLDEAVSVRLQHELAFAPVPPGRRSARSRTVPRRRCAFPVRRKCADSTPATRLAFLSWVRTRDLQIGHLFPVNRRGWIARRALDQDRRGERTAARAMPPGAQWYLILFARGGASAVMTPGIGRRTNNAAGELWLLQCKMIGT
jgi:hypothetical protein